jgi:hypothetical protein
MINKNKPPISENKILNKNLSNLIKEKQNENQVKFYFNNSLYYSIVN